MREEQRRHDTEEPGYGEHLLKQPGNALSREFGRAFSQRNLYFMRWPTQK